jgi:competence protein ComEC
LPPYSVRDGHDLDLRPPVRLDLWALLLAAGISVGTVVPPLAPLLVVASLTVAVAVLVWRDLVPAEWRPMAVLGPAFATAGVAIALLHVATKDPLAELAAIEPGEVVLVGRMASPPERSGFGYMADLRVDHLWYDGSEIVRGGGVEVFAGDLSVGVGDRVMVNGEISLPETGDDGFDYARYLRVSAKTPSRPGSSSVPRSPRMLAGECN